MKRSAPRASKVTAAARHLFFTEVAQAVLPWCLSVGDKPRWHGNGAPTEDDTVEDEKMLRAISENAVALAFDIADVFMREADAVWTGRPK